MKSIFLFLSCILFINTAPLAQSINFKGIITDNKNVGVKDVQVCSSYKRIKKVKSNRRGIFKLGISGKEPLIFLTPDEDVYSVPVGEVKKATFVYHPNKKQIQYNNTIVNPLRGEGKTLALSYFENPFTQFPHAFAVIKHECPSLVIDYDSRKIFVTKVVESGKGVLVLLDESPTTFQNLELLSPAMIKSVQLLKRPEELHIYKTMYNEPFDAILKIQLINK